MEARQEADKCGFVLCTSMSVAQVMLDFEIFPVCALHLSALSPKQTCCSEPTSVHGDIWDRFLHYEDLSKKAEDQQDSRNAAKWWRMSHSLFQLPPSKHISNSVSDSPLKRSRF